jgi:hypothetical protein
MVLTKNYENLLEIKKDKIGKGLLIEADGGIPMLTNEFNRTILEDIRNSNDWKIPDPFIIYAVLTKYDTKNANNRIYPRDVLVPSVEKYQELIAARGAASALEHPESSLLNSREISHIVTEAHWEGKTLMGQMELHISPGYRKFGFISTLGDMAANILLSKIRLGTSSRGVGEVTEKLGQYYVSDYELLAFDLVMTPSSRNSWLSIDSQELNQFKEGQEEHNVDKILTEKINKIKQILL